jgi:secreted PhoX family phosphatase
MPFERIATGNAVAASLPYSPDYGPLAPVLDVTTGLPLLNLPQGFTYASYGWTHDVMSDNVPTPGSHDGMAVVGVDKGNIVLVRNHERTGFTGSYAAAKITYDPVATGGTTNLTFDPRIGKWLGSYASLGGTLTNCAGGPTPWNTWLTCEETTQGPLTNANYTKQHGWVFEVPAFGQANPQPLTAMGAFAHEATATDPVTSIVYLTEDRTPSGFYRFIANVRTRLSQVGRLQMLKVAGTSATKLYGGLRIRPASRTAPPSTWSGWTSRIPRRSTLPALTVAVSTFRARRLAAPGSVAWKAPGMETQ